MDLQKYATFKELLLDNYEYPDLEQIAEQGCANCCPAGMIYYSETNAIYDHFCHDLHDIVGDYISEAGETPKELIEHLNNATTFKNTMVWLCAELLATEICHQQNENAFN